jgi:hypothetical protein
MNNWRWDIPHDFGDQDDCSNPQTTSLVNVKRIGDRCSWYESIDLGTNIEPPSCRQPKPGALLAVRPLNWDEIIKVEDDNENWEDPGAQSGGSRHRSDGNGNDGSEGEEDTQGGEKGQRK